MPAASFRHWSRRWSTPQSRATPAPNPFLSALWRGWAMPKRMKAPRWTADVQGTPGRRMGSEARGGAGQTDVASSPGDDHAD